MTAPPRTTASVAPMTPRIVLMAAARNRRRGFGSWVMGTGGLTSVTTPGPGTFTKSSSTGSGAGFGVDVLPQPVVDEFDDLVAVPVEEHLVHIAVNADVLEAHELVFRARLVQPFRNARVEHPMIGPFRRH